MRVAKHPAENKQAKNHFVGSVTIYSTLMLWNARKASMTLKFSLAIRLQGVMDTKVLIKYRGEIHFDIKQGVMEPSFN